MPDRPLAVFRVDASTRIGGGHLMRCLALADAWRRRGGDARFAGVLSPGARQRVRKAGMEVRDMPAGAGTAADGGHADHWLEELGTDAPPAWVVLDGYGFSGDDQRRITEKGIPLLVVDDNAHLSRYECDVLVNPNPGGEVLSYEIDSAALILAGSRFTLLRPEFPASRADLRHIPEVARRLLVTVGAGDDANVTGRVLEALRSIGGDLQVEVVVGPDNPHLAELSAVADEVPGAVRLVKDPPDMAELMARADLAVSGAGGTCWEMAFMGLPAIAITVAENQGRLAATAAKAGCALALGWHEDVGAGEIADAIRDLQESSDRRLSMSRAGRALVDGAGAARVGEVMWARASGDASAARLRPVEPGDVWQIFRLANEPAVRRRSFSPEPIPYERHREWFDRKLRDPDCRLYALVIGGAVAAQIRYDKTDDSAEISFSATPAFRGMGLGTRILRETAEQACRELDVPLVRGLVFPDNEASARAFLGAGFRRGEATERDGRECLVFERRTVRSGVV